jgi:lipid A 3-O-deacylase
MTRSIPILVASLVAAAALALPPRAAAQNFPEVRVQADNDNFSFWLPRKQRGDFEYTHGMRVTIRSNTAAGWGDRFAAGLPVCDAATRLEQRCLLTLWELGQQIYTPRVNSSQVVLGQRPHAGWLYGAMTAVSQQASERHSVRLELGVTGPPSLAGTLQTAVHRWAGYWTPRGWDNQLAFEPGVLVRYGYDRLLLAPQIGGVRVAELTSNVGLSAGNVITGASAGLDARLGFNVPPSWGGGSETLSLYALAGIRADAYLRNLFLDGNTFQPSHRVEKLPFVERHHVGAGLRIENLDLLLRVQSRGREYRTEPGGHRYTSVEAVFRP